MSMSFKCVSLGCKVNYYEIEALRELLKKNNYIETKDKADIYVVNTCSVTNEADKKDRKVIRELLRENPNAIMCVMGCYSQIKKEDIMNIEGVSIILGTSNKEKVIEYIKKFQENQTQIVDVENVLTKFPIDNFRINEFKSHTRAYLKVQDGCTNYCTYCLIPYARGYLRSKPLDIAVSEAKKLVENGHKEIIITGIHTGAYGKDLKDTNLYDLLYNLSEIDGLERIRISSIEINEVTDKILDLIKSRKNIVKHLHIPIQSGSNNILKEMNRHYTLDEFKERIKYIKSYIEGIAITTDIIVGFPGETNEDFNESFNTLKELEFSELHVFPYSKRDGTKASIMKNQIDPQIKKERVNKLLDLNHFLARKYINSNLNSNRYVLYEEYIDGYLYGHTDNFIYLKTKGDKSYINKNVLTKIIKEEYPVSIGEIIEVEE